MVQISIQCKITNLPDLSPQEKRVQNKIDVHHLRSERSRITSIMCSLCVSQKVYYPSRRHTFHSFCRTLQDKLSVKDQD
jgi:hypothetical protein